MKKTRIYEIINFLKQEEWKDLKDLLNSPLFNSNRQIIKLFEYLYYNNEVLKDKFNNHEVFAFVYPGKKYSENMFNRLTSDFVKAAEKLLLWQELGKERIRNKIKLLGLYNDRSADKNFNKYKLELNDYIKSEVNKDLVFYLNEYEYKSELLIDSYIKGTLETEKSLLDIDSSINFTVASFKLEIIIKIAESGMALSDIVKNVRFYSEINSFIKKNIKTIRSNHLTVYYKYLVLNMLLYKDKKYFREIKIFLNSKINILTNDQKVYLYEKLINYCSEQKDGRYKKEEYNLIKELEKNNLMPYQLGNCTYDYFLSYIDIALQHKDPYWAEAFVSNYGKYIYKVYQQNTVNLAMAYICMFTRRYDNVLKYISRVKLNSDFFYLSVKILHLCVLFEKEKFQTIKYEVNSLMTYIKKNLPKNPDKFIDYYNFCVYIKKLSRIRQKKSFHEIKELFLEVKESKSLVNKDWLERKLALIS